MGHPSTFGSTSRLVAVALAAVLMVPVWAATASAEPSPGASLNPPTPEPSPQKLSAPAGAKAQGLDALEPAPNDGNGTVPVATDDEKLKAAPVVGLDLSQPSEPLRLEDRDFVFELWLLAKPGTEVKGAALLSLSEWDADTKTCVECSLFIRRGIHEAAERDAKNEVRDRTSAEVAARRRTQAAELVEMPVTPRLIGTGDRDFVISLFAYLKQSKPQFTGTVVAAEAAFVSTKPGAVDTFLGGGLADAHALDQRRLIDEANAEDEAAKREANRRFDRKRAANAVGVDVKEADDAWMTTTDDDFIRDLSRKIKGDNFWSLTYTALADEVLNGSSDSWKSMIGKGIFQEVERDRVRRNKDIVNGYRAKVVEVRDRAIYHGHKNIARAGAAALATNSINALWSYLENRESLPPDSTEMTVLRARGTNTTAIVTRGHLGRDWGVDREVWRSGAGNWDLMKSTPLNGDFDGDGKRDLAVLYGSGASWRVQFIADLDGAKPTPKLKWDAPPDPTTKKGYDLKSAAGGDFNGDGHTDIAVYGKNAAGAPILLVLTPDSKGVWAVNAYTVPSALIVGRLVAGDVNGDKKADFITIVQDATKGMQIWVALSGATRPGAAVAKWADQNFAVSTTTEPLATDLDRDGDVEIVLLRQEQNGTSKNGASLQVFNKLNGTVGRSQIWRAEGGLGATKIILNAAEVNGDDYIDLIFQYAIVDDQSRTYTLLNGPDGLTNMRMSSALYSVKNTDFRIAR
jgi:hypothetical protein